MFTLLLRRGWVGWRVSRKGYFSPTASRLQRATDVLVDDEGDGRGRHDPGQVRLQALVEAAPALLSGTAAMTRVKSQAELLVKMLRSPKQLIRWGVYTSYYL